MRHFTTAAVFLVLAVSAFAEPDEWSHDLEHAHIEWEVNHMDLARTVGRFDAFGGTLSIDEDNPTNSARAPIVGAASVNSNHIGRGNHVQATEYLYAPASPWVAFTSGAMTMASGT